jgi:hypothetical protein
MFHEQADGSIVFRVNANDRRPGCGSERGNRNKEGGRLRPGEEEFLIGILEILLP